MSLFIIIIVVVVFDVVMTEPSVSILSQQKTTGQTVSVVHRTDQQL